MLADGAGAQRVLPQSEPNTSVLASGPGQESQLSVAVMQLATTFQQTTERMLEQMATTQASLVQQLKANTEQTQLLHSQVAKMQRQLQHLELKGATRLRQHTTDGQATISPPHSHVDDESSSIRLRQLFVRATAPLPPCPVRVLKQAGIKFKKNSYEVELHRGGETNAFFLTMSSVKGADRVYQESRAGDNANLFSVQRRRAPRDPQAQRLRKKTHAHPLDRRSPTSSPTGSPALPPAKRVKTSLPTKPTGIPRVAQKSEIHRRALAQAEVEPGTGASDTGDRNTRKQPKPGKKKRSAPTSTAPSPKLGDRPVQAKGKKKKGQANNTGNVFYPPRAGDTEANQSPAPTSKARSTKKTKRGATDSLTTQSAVPTPIDVDASGSTSATSTGAARPSNKAKRSTKATQSAKVAQPAAPTPTNADAPGSTPGPSTEDDSNRRTPPPPQQAARKHGGQRGRGQSSA
jgi:hypothetical protein